MFCLFPKDKKFNSCVVGQAGDKWLGIRARSRWKIHGRRPQHQPHSFYNAAAPFMSSGCFVKHFAFFVQRTDMAEPSDVFVLDNRSDSNICKMAFRKEMHLLHFLCIFQIPHQSSTDPHICVFVCLWFVFVYLCICTLSLPLPNPPSILHRHSLDPANLFCLNINKRTAIDFHFYRKYLIFPPFCSFDLQ